MSISDDAHSVPIVGLPLAVVTTTGIFLFLAVLGVGTRIFVNYHKKIFGLDDGLVLFSALMFIAVFGLTLHGATVGIGTKNSGLNTWLQSQAEKYYTIWILCYLSGMVMIKSSVCVTLRRILPPTQWKMHASVWVLVGLSWASWCVAFFAVILLCRPIEANWNPNLVTEGKAECGSKSVLVGISQTVTSCSIITDVGCTVLPGIMLWKTSMEKTSRLEVFALLSIASVASVATIARAPYLSHYADPTNDLLYYCGYMVMFSNIETGIGCFASSLPSIRRLYYLVRKPEHSSEPSQPQNSDNIITIGGSGMVKGKGKKAKLSTFGSVYTYTNTTVRGEPEVHSEGGQGDWERLTDERSDKGFLVCEPENKTIATDCTYAVELHSVESRPGSVS